MHRITQFVQGHQQVFLEATQPDVQTAFIQALKKLGLKQAAGATAVTRSVGNRRGNPGVGDVAQGVQREIHGGRRYPSLGHASFGAAYEPWSDDMACILQGSCLPGSTRYCRTRSMFSKLELTDIAQGTTVSNGLPTGKRHYHSIARRFADYRLLDACVGAVGIPSDWHTSSHYTTDSSAPRPEGKEELPQAEGQVSQRQRLKMAVRDYGSTVVVFHVCISLMSLGGFYLAVSSGIDVQAMLSFLGFSREVIESKLATGTSTFVMAYAVHKCFAPVRIGITLTCTPFIVRYLRGAGLLKRPLPTK